MAGEFVSENPLSGDLLTRADVEVCPPDQHTKSNYASAPTAELLIAMAGKRCKQSTRFHQQCADKLGTNPAAAVIRTHPMDASNGRRRVRLPSSFSIRLTVPISSSFCSAIRHRGMRSASVAVRRCATKSSYDMPLTTSRQNSS